MPDDYLSTTQTTGAVEVGGSATGDIETGGDHDWFAVTLEAGRIYRIDLEGSRTGGGTLSDPYLYGIYNANGHRLNGTTDDDEGAGFNSRLYFTTEEAGTYYVAAGAYGTRSGTYTLSVTDATDSVPDDFATGTGTSGAVAVDGSARGEINYAYDRDWFAVNLQAGKSYEIDLKGSRTGDGTLYDPYLYGVHDANGDLLAGTTDNNRGEGLNSRVTFTAEEAGVYYVAARADGRGKGTYTLSVTEIVDDFGTGTGTSGAVEVGGSATGEIETRGDRDWFAVTLEAGGTYRIDLKGSSTGAGTLDDPYLRGVYDAAGVLLAGTANNNGGEGYNSRVYLRAEYAGAYYVAAGANGGRLGTYTLSVTEVPDDFGTGTGTSGAVEVDGSATGEIEFKGDRDWFAVELDAGRTYRIDLEGSETGDGTLTDPYLRGVYDANTDLLAGMANNDGGEGYNSRVYLREKYAGAYYVEAGANGGGLGTYTLSVTEVADDFGTGTGTSGAVEMGGSVTGEIEFEGDRDWFAVELDAGRTYRIDLEGYDTGAGTLSNPYLYGVRNANGRFIAGTTNDDSGAGRNSRVTFTAEEAGTYYVAAGADGDGEGTYTLSVSDFTDDFAAETGTRGVVEVGGSATGEIDYGGDRDWFAVDARGGQELPDRPGGPAERGRHPVGPVSARGLRRGRRPPRRHDERQRRRGPQQPGVFHGGRGRHLLCSGQRQWRRGRHLQSVCYGGRGRFRGGDRGERRGGGGRLGDGRYRIRGRPRLVRGGARGGQDLPDRPQGLVERGRHPIQPLPARGPRREWRSPRRHDERQRRRSHQQPAGVHGGGCRHLLRGGQRSWRRGRHLQAVGGGCHGHLR